jgi:hypothetical protein
MLEAAARRNALQPPRNQETLTFCGAPSNASLSRCGVGGPFHVRCARPPLVMLEVWR